MAVDHVKGAVSVAHRLGEATLVAQRGAGRAGRLVRASAFRVDQERVGRFTDHFARLARTAHPHLHETTHFVNATCHRHSISSIRLLTSLHHLPTNCIHLLLQLIVIIH